MSVKITIEVHDSVAETIQQYATAEERTPEQQVQWWIKQAIRMGFQAKLERTVEFNLPHDLLWIQQLPKREA